LWLPGTQHELTAEKRSDPLANLRRTRAECCRTVKCAPLAEGAIPMNAGLVQNYPTTEAEEKTKRGQIVDGARDVFLAQGFDGASAGEIARSQAFRRAHSTSTSRTKANFQSRSRDRKRLPGRSHRQVRRDRRGRGTHAHMGRRTLYAEAARASLAVSRLRLSPN
jgi:hypothetical protein